MVELGRWLDAQYQMDSDFAATKFGDDARFEFEESLITTTCDPRLDFSGEVFKQLEFTKTRTSHGLRITITLDHQQTTLAACLEFLFGTKRLEGASAYQIDQSVPDFGELPNAEGVRKCVPDLRVVADQRRWIKRLPHTLYAVVEVEPGDAGARTQPLVYPARIDFAYPPYNRYLAEGVHPHAYQLRAMLATTKAEGSTLVSDLRALIRDPLDNQWYAATTRAAIHAFRLDGESLTDAEAMAHATVRASGGAHRGIVYFYVREDPAELGKVRCLLAETAVTRALTVEDGSWEPVDVRRELVAWLCAGASGRDHLEGSLPGWGHALGFELTIDLSIRTDDARLEGKQRSRTSALTGGVLRLLYQDLRCGTLPQALTRSFSPDPCTIGDQPSGEPPYSGKKWMTLGWLPSKTLHIHLHRAIETPGPVGSAPHQVWTNDFAYPARLDFGAPQFKHLLSRGVAPRKYVLSGVLVGHVGADGELAFKKLRAYVRNASNGTWHNLDDTNAKVTDRMALCTDGSGYVALRLYYSAVEPQAGTRAAASSSTKRKGKMAAKEARPHDSGAPSTSQAAVPPRDGFRDQALLTHLTEVCAAMPQEIKDKCDQAQELMDSGATSEAARVMCEVLRMKELGDALEKAPPRPKTAAGREEAEAQALADEGVSAEDIRANYAPCGRPINQVVREERVKERLRARLEKLPGYAAAEYTRGATQSTVDHAKTEEKQRLRARLEKLPAGARAYAVAAAADAAAEYTRGATQSTAAQAAAQGAAAAAAALAAAASDAECQRSGSSSTGADAASLVAQADWEGPAARQAGACLSLFANAHIEQAMREEIDDPSKAYTPIHFRMDVDEYARTSAAECTTSNYWRDKAMGTMKEEHCRVKQTTIDVDPSTGTFRDSINAWRHSMLEMTDGHVVFGRELVSAPDTLAVRVTPWPQTITKHPTMGRYENAIEASSVAARGGLVDFHYPMGFTMDLDRIADRAVTTAKYRLAAVLYLDSRERGASSAPKGAFANPYIPLKATVDGVTNPAAARFNHMRGRWLRSDQDVLLRGAHPPFLMGVFAGEVDRAGCEALARLALILTAVAQQGDAPWLIEPGVIIDWRTACNLYLVEEWLVVEAERVVKQCVPSVLWDNIATCIMEIHPAPPLWLANFLRLVRERLERTDGNGEWRVAGPRVDLFEAAEIFQDLLKKTSGPLADRAARGEATKLAEAAKLFGDGLTADHADIQALRDAGPHDKESLLAAALLQKTRSFAMFAAECLGFADAQEEEDVDVEGDPPLEPHDDAEWRSAQKTFVPQCNWEAGHRVEGLLAPILLRVGVDRSSEHTVVLENALRALSAVLHARAEDHAPEPGESWAAVANSIVQVLYASHDQAVRFFFALMAVRSWNLHVEIWKDAVRIVLRSHPAPHPKWLQRMLMGFATQLALVNDKAQHKAALMPPRRKVLRHEAYFRGPCIAGSAGAAAGWRRNLPEASAGCFHYSPGDHVERLGPATVGINEDGEEQMAVLFYRLEQNQQREEQVVAAQLKAGFGADAWAEKVRALLAMTSIPACLAELHHVGLKTMRHLDAAEALGRLVGMLSMVQSDDDAAVQHIVHTMCLQKTPPAFADAIEKLGEQLFGKRHTRKGHARRVAEKEGPVRAAQATWTAARHGSPPPPPAPKPPPPPKPTKREKDQEAARLAHQLEEACKAEREKQMAAGRAAEAEKKAAADAKREEKRKQAEAERLRAEAIALEEAEDAEENAKEAEEMRVQQVRESRKADHLEQREAQQTKRDPKATDLQRQLVADAEQVEADKKEAARVAKLAAQQREAQAVQDAAYANGHEARMEAKAAEAAASKARKKANKERERAEAAAQKAEAQAAARTVAATTAELDALWSGPDAGGAPSPWANAARADQVEAAAVAQEAEDLEKALALSRLDSPPPAAAPARADADADAAPDEGGQARARAEAAVDQARARIARDWADRRAATPAGATRGRGRGGGRGRGRGSAAVAAPAAPPQEEEDRPCVVCMAVEPTNLCVPCGHQCLCAACVQIYDPVAKGCPICREPVAQVIRVLRP